MINKKNSAGKRVRVRHSSQEDCPKFLHRHTDDRKCEYPLCRSPESHLTPACKDLQGRCSRCLKRGHTVDTCGALTLDEYERLYEECRDFGVFSSRHRKDNPHTRECWDFLGPLWEKTACVWRTGATVGLWTPPVPGLLCVPDDDYPVEEGSLRDQALKKIKWG